MKFTVISKKMKERFHFLKGPAKNAIATVNKYKKVLSYTLRKSNTLRRFLNLPSDRVVSFKEWLQSPSNGDKWVEVDGEEVVLHKIPSLSEPQNEWYFLENAESCSEAVGVAFLSDGYVFGHNAGQYMNNKNEYLWDLSRENWKYFDSFFLDSVLRLPEIEKVSGTVAILANEYAYGNFSHWTFDLLPKIGLLEKTTGLDAIDFFYVGYEERPYQIETLLQLNIPREKIRRFSSSSHINAKELIVPRLSGYSRTYHRKWVLDYLQTKLGSKVSLWPARKLFISRGDATFRILKQEAELFQLLEKHGFERIELAGLSLPKTIDLFTDATSVVGAFGSGLMNIAFCHPKTRVVEIVNPKFYNCYHWYLSTSRNLHHAVYFGNERVLKREYVTSQLTSDISIDVQDCYNFIKKECEL